MRIIVLSAHAIEATSKCRPKSASPICARAGPTRLRLNLCNRHYHEYDTYFSFRASPPVRYREDEIVDESKN
jgi:hypothetical protein